MSTKNVEWNRVPTPKTLNDCSCGSKKVEEQPDGLVRKYRCYNCKTFLGDITIGHEP